MSKSTKIIIIVLVALGLGTLLYFIVPSNDGEKKKKDEKPEFKKELKDQRRNSSGAFILYELLKDYKNTVSLKTISDPLEKNLKQYQTDYPTVYFLVDDKMSISQKDMDTLYDFVSDGNVAFISAQTLNKKFYNFFFSSYPYNTYRDTVYKLNFYHQDLKLNTNYPLKIKRKGNIERYAYRYMEVDDLYYDDDLVVISTDKKHDRPIFIKFKVGEGWIYIHCVPEAFYNASMFEEEGLDYAESVFSNLPKGHYLWHEHSKKYNPLDDYKNNKGSNNSSMKRESPLQYILGSRSLSWAYFTLLLSLLLYIIFKVKRKQRVIPAVEPNTNNSLDFIKTISNLYLRQNKHNKFIKHYEQSFLNFIRDKYYIKSPAKISKEYVQSVSLKSDIEEEKIMDIFKGIKEAKTNYNYSGNDLIELHKKIEYFYRNCK